MVRRMLIGDSVETVTLTIKTLFESYYGKNLTLIQCGTQILQLTDRDFLHPIENAFAIDVIKDEPITLHWYSLKTYTYGFLNGKIILEAWNEDWNPTVTFTISDNSTLKLEQYS